MARRYASFFVVALILLASCSGPSSEPSTTSNAVATPSGSATSGAESEQRHPDIVSVQLNEIGENQFRLDVTVSSPYDTPERYADGWRVLGPDGVVLAEHELGHDHAAEQPFTRTQSGVKIPEGISHVIIEGRDQKFGYGGATVSVEVVRN